MATRIEQAELDAQVENLKQQADTFAVKVARDILAHTDRKSEKLAIDIPQERIKEALYDWVGVTKNDDGKLVMPLRNDGAAQRLTAMKRWLEKRQTSLITPAKGTVGEFRESLLDIIGDEVQKQADVDIRSALDRIGPAKGPEKHMTGDAGPNTGRRVIRDPRGLG